MASELIKAMLLRQMSNAGRPMYSPWEALGSVALTAALAKRQDRENTKDQKDQNNLAGVLAQQIGVPQTQIPMESLTPGGQEPPLSVNTSPVTQSPQYQALSGLPKEALQQVWMQRMLSGKDPIKLGQNDVLLDPNTLQPIASNKSPEKPPQIQAYNVRMPNGQIAIGMETDGGLYRVGKDGKPDKSNPITDGQIVGLAVNAPTVDDLNPAPLVGDKPTERDLAAVQVNTKNLLSLTDRLRQQLSADPTTGLVGTLVTSGQAIKAQVDQVRRLTGDKDYPALANVTQYGDVFDQFTWLDAEARKSAAVKSNIVRLAYVQAKAMDPGGKIAKDDVKAAIEMMAASGGSPQQILAGLDEVDSFARTNAANTYESIHKVPMPEDWLGAIKPQGPQKGVIQDGYRFKGGDPADPNNWEKVP